MAKDMEWLVPMAAVRDADLRVVPRGLSGVVPPPTARVAELRRRVLGGYYASERMMDLVARRLQASSDL